VGLAGTWQGPLLLLARVLSVARKIFGCCLPVAALCQLPSRISDDDFFAYDSQAEALSNVWQKHSAQLCTVLEHCLRLQTAVPAFSPAPYWKCITSLSSLQGVLFPASVQKMGEQL